jgi:hypothetical protein
MGVPEVERLPERSLQAEDPREARIGKPMLIDRPGIPSAPPL